MLKKPNTVQTILSLVCIFLLLYSNYTIVNNLTFGAYIKAPLSPNGPTVKDDNLVVEKITDGLEIPTSMAFLGPNDLLVTEKETGRVIHIVDGQIQEVPDLDVSVASAIERGLLGIAVAKQPDGKTFVFLSYTESGNEEDGSDIGSSVVLFNEQAPLVTLT